MICCLFRISCVLSKHLLSIVSWVTIYYLCCPGMQFIISCILGHNLLFIASWATINCLFILSWATVYYLLHLGSPFITCYVLGYKKLSIVSLQQLITYCVYCWSLSTLFHHLHYAEKRANFWISPEVTLFLCITDMKSQILR